MTAVSERATIADLYRVPDKGKAELVNGRIVHLMPTGGALGRAGGDVYSSLRQHERRTGGGYASPNNVGFTVGLPNRNSFSSDAAFFVGPKPDMHFPVGAPAFAVEIRSENDYGPAVELAIAQKRNDYFAAGTLVVWDVDLLGEEVIRSYRADAPDTPIVYRRGEVAHAEPAVPGWRFPVDEMFG